MSTFSHFRKLCDLFFMVSSIGKHLKLSLKYAYLWFYRTILRHIREVVGNKKASVSDSLKWNTYVKNKLGIHYWGWKSCRVLWLQINVFIRERSLFHIYLVSFVFAFTISLWYGSQGRKWEWKTVKSVVSEKPGERPFRVAVQWRAFLFA